MEFHNHTVTPKLHIAWIYSTYGFSSLYDLINSAFLTRKALHFSYIDAHKKSRENLGSNTLCYSRLYLTVLNDNKLRWYDKQICGLTKQGRKRLKELKEIKDSSSSRGVNPKLIRYLQKLGKMHLQVPDFFRSVIQPKPFYQHLVAFCRENDIPEDIVARVVPALIGYIETGHMRPILFVGEKGCGKTTAVRMFLKEALQLPIEVIKAPHTDGGHGLTGDCDSFQSADVGSIAKAQIRWNRLIVPFLIDEVDKAPHPTSRSCIEDELLSITDESCNDVYDNFLELPLVGLEHCPIFFTANDLQKVSPILADRCTVIPFPKADAARIKSISRKYVNKLLNSNLYSMISFDYALMDEHIDSLVNKDITSLRKHQQLIEAVLDNALHYALSQTSDEVVTVTEEMFKDAECAVLGSTKRQVGFSS